MTQTNMTSDAPRQAPGSKEGRRTPSDMPTNPALMTRIPRKTKAVSELTGMKRGSRNVKTKNPERIPDKRPV
jgi:hypothetical protein